MQTLPATREKTLHRGEVLPKPPQTSPAAEFQQSLNQHGFWRRPHRRRGQHQQSEDDSRIQPQESLQRLAVYLRSDHGSRRPDHHAGAARAAGIGSAFAAELIESWQLFGVVESVWRDAKFSITGPAYAGTATIEICRCMSKTGGTPVLHFPLVYLWFLASTMRSISITLIHWPWRISV